MGWNHPSISLEDMVKLFKGFVDVLILGSGYRSSGLLAHWDVPNIRKAFQWALFFENVLMQIRSSEYHDESFKELDEALSQITSDPSFPQGLAHLSAATLIRAREIVLRQLIQGLPMRDAHLRAFLVAVVEMDLDVLSESRDDRLSKYLDKLSLQNSLVQDGKCLKKTLSTSKSENLTVEYDDTRSNEWTSICLQELSERQSQVSCISSAGKVLDIVCRATDVGNVMKEDGLFEDLLGHEKSLMNEHQIADFITWYSWKSRNLSYILNRRTIRLVSGASMIFSAPKAQWLRVFECINMPAESGHCLHHRMELLLLGCAGTRWDKIIKHFSTISFDHLTTSERFLEVCSFFSKKSRILVMQDDIMYSKENYILNYVMKLLGTELQHMWLLPPVLCAVAIPTWSPLFRVYLSQIEIQLKGDAVVAMKKGMITRTVNSLRGYGVYMSSKCSARTYSLPMTTNDQCFDQSGGLFSSSRHLNQTILISS